LKLDWNNIKILSFDEYISEVIPSKRALYKNGYNKFINDFKIGNFYTLM